MTPGGKDTDAVTALANASEKYKNKPLIVTNTSRPKKTEKYQILVFEERKKETTEQIVL